MTPPGHAALRQLALRMLAHRTALDRPAGAEAIAAAADCAYEDLARVVAPIIGDMGWLWPGASSDRAACPP